MGSGLRVGIKATRHHAPHGAVDAYY